MELIEEEKKAIEYIKEFKNEVFEGVGNKSIMAKNIDILLNLIDKQQNKIEAQEMEHQYDQKMIDDLKGEMVHNWIHKDKIKELKEKVEKEMINNPYDFSYMINELLEENDE